MHEKGTNEMRKLSSLTAAAFGLLAFVMLSQAPAQAQFPAYLHAISDLRTARAYLEQDTRSHGAGARHHAIEQIDKAIDEMKKAAIDDGKNPWHTPPPQSGGDPGMPVHSAIRLLNEAHGDVARGQDSPENRGLQVRSLKHIDEARKALEEAL
jgi:hypothetical protein